MLREQEFRDWYDDYSARWPAVANYLRAQGTISQMLDTWHQTLAAFDAVLLDRVTAGIIIGTLEPVANVALGTFGSEIRQRCRTLLDRERQDADRARSAKDRKQSRQDFQPIVSGDLVTMICCGIVCDQLLSEITGEPVDTNTRSYQGGALRPDVPYDAAIILCDDHTAAEAHAAHATLQAAGIDWEEVLELAGRMRSRGVKLVQEASA